MCLHENNYGKELFSHVVNDFEGIDMAVRSTSRRKTSTDVAHRMERRGMVLPFKPLSLAFNHVNYYIDTPSVSHFFKSLQLM